MSCRLERLRQAFETGHRVPVLMDALLVCRETGEAPPWVLDAAFSFLAQLVTDFPRKAQRAGNPHARWRQDMVHFARYDAVSTIRDCYQHDQKEYIRRVHEVFADDPTERERMLKRIPYDFGSTWSDAYDHAHLLLRGTFAAGSRDQMRRSYALVKRTRGGRYRCPSVQVRRALKLPPLPAI